MPKFAANLSMLYPEHDFLSRFAAAAQDGFKGVEYLFPYAYDAQILAKSLSDNGLVQVLFNAPPGNWDAGERGLACLPDRVNEFQTGIKQACSYAKVLNCSRIHVMAGIVPADTPTAQLNECYVHNLRWAAQHAAPFGIQLLIEPINTRDMPGYFLNLQAQAHALLHDIGEPNVHVQFDLYHCQIMEGDLSIKLRQYLPTGRVGHIQIAGVPQRHEPNIGEINYEYLFSLIDELSWNGWIGCEYRPSRGLAAGGTTAGLSWISSNK